MNKVADHHRREKRRVNAMEAVEHLVESTPEELDHLDKLAVREALQRLNRKDLRIVRLTYWDDLAAGEVAEVLGMRQGAVWTRLHRARNQMKVFLEGSEVSTRER